MSGSSQAPDGDQEDEIVASAIAGDTAALERLLRAHAPEVCARQRVAERWRSSFDGEDLIQVTSMEAALRIGSLRTPTVVAFRAWLARIAERLLLDAIRSLAAQKRTPPERRITSRGAGRSTENLLDELCGDGPTASAIMRGREEVEQLGRAIAGLPPAYRAVVQGLDLEERSVDEVARDVGRSRGAVHMLRMRAHERLREQLS